MIWNSLDEDDEDYALSSNLSRNESCGVLVTLGFVPGLKVKAIPLLRPKEVGSAELWFSGFNFALLQFQLKFFGLRTWPALIWGIQNFQITEKGLKSAMDSFLADIKNFTSSVSSSASPLGILMFAVLLFYFMMQLTFLLSNFLLVLWSNIVYAYRIFMPMQDLLLKQWVQFSYVMSLKHGQHLFELCACGASLYNSFAWIVLCYVFPSTVYCHAYLSKLIETKATDDRFSLEVYMKIIMI